MRLIDADEVQKIIDHIRGKYVDTYNRRNKTNQFFWDTIRYIEKKVRSIPTIEDDHVVHGEWILISQDDEFWKYACSNCGYEVVIDRFIDETTSPFCEKCGCKMDGKAV